MTCTSNCKTCTHSPANMVGFDFTMWCYMFREEPEGVCQKWKPKYTPQEFSEEDVGALYAASILASILGIKK